MTELGRLDMTDQQMVAARAAGDDVLGRRGFFANVDRARAFGSSSLSGLLDVFGVLVMVAAGAIVVVLLTTSPRPPGEWLTEALVAIGGTVGGLMLFALSRMVTYAKACAVLLAKVSADSA